MNARKILDQVITRMVIRNTDECIAALDAAGYVIVPKVPTPEMVNACQVEYATSDGDEDYNATLSENVGLQVWVAMLAAAPAP